MDFDKFPIEKQVEFINSQLEKDENLSLRKLCEKFGINRNTIGSRFKNKGYYYDPYKRKYKTATKVLVKKEDNSSVTKMKKMSVIKNEKCNNSELVFLKEIEKKKNDLLEILDLKDDIKRLIQNHDKSIINVEPVELKIDKDILQGSSVNRSVKIYELVYEELQELYDMYPQFKKYDILSQAIHEFYLRYRR